MKFELMISFDMVEVTSDELSILETWLNFPMRFLNLEVIEVDYFYTCVTEGWGLAEDNMDD